MSRVKLENVHKSYGNQKVLDDVSFEINKGEIVGLLGPNGAGKSTLMKIITGYIKADEGKVTILDKEISQNPVALKKHIGYLPEHNPLYLDMYVKEYLEFLADLHKIDKKKITDIIQLVELQNESHKKIKELSKGYRQRVGLAAALLHDPKVLILDEPTTGLDPNQLVSIRNLIKEIGKTKTVLLSTHIMQEVEAICDRVIIINKGQIVADDDIKNLTKEKTLTEVFTALTT
jgi:ABC-2 type transport system ATP-binding protein